MERQDLIRFHQLFNIAFTSDKKTLKSTCTDELKRQLLIACSKVDSDKTYASYGYASASKVLVNPDRIKSLYEELFP